LADRLQTTVRWWSAPFDALDAELPTSGRILEIGCGRGLFSTFLALSHPERVVVGVDIDADKIGTARAVATGLDRVQLRFEVASSGQVEPGPWDAIAIVDMLYLLPAPAQRALVVAAAGQLAAGGVLLIKEMSTTPRWKARWNVMQETVSVSILGATARAEPGVAHSGSSRAPHFDFVPPETMAGWLVECGLTVALTRLDRHRVHPHHLLTGRPADGDRGPIGLHDEPAGRSPTAESGGSSCTGGGDPAQ
jgi:SAM-dependent methyltransferase